tara:strand:- start:545 stop:1018 length:474 start_codon:yes stop_codon:yes gene_type:complete
MLRIRGILVTVFVTLVLSGCLPPPKPTLTPLEIQSLQSREYEATKDVVFPSVISVLQDVGYTITNADIKTGLISAESSADSDYSFLLGVTEVSQTKATAFVEQIGSKTKARLSFVEVIKTSSGTGQTDRQDTPLIDAKLYENAFNKIENAIFIRSSN